MLGLHAADEISIERLIPNLDRFASWLAGGGGRLGLVEELISLAATYDRAAARGALEEFRKLCQELALHARLLDDPFTRRAYERPRGYAGDATMLDYIYRPQKLRISEFGNVVHRATTSAGSARSIRWRRSHLAACLLDGMEEAKRLRVLLVASGHLRELDIVSTATTGRNVEITALDRDGDALRKAMRSYGQFDIRPLNCSLSYLLKHNNLEPFDLIYSAGSFDYLDDRTATAPLEALVSLLRPGGRLIVGNHTPATDGRGYMEGMMDWRLLYRTESDLLRLGRVAVGEGSLRTYRDVPGNIAYLEIGGSQEWRQMAAANPKTGTSVARRLGPWLIAVALVLSLAPAARAEGDAVVDPRGPYFCLRWGLCWDRCPIRYDVRCSMACRSLSLLCQAYRTNDAPLFRGALLGLASANLLRAYRKQHGPSESSAINTVGELVEQCESAQHVEREDCANLVGAWVRVIARRQVERRQPMDRDAPGMACAREAQSVPDATLAAVFVAWARQHPSDWNRSAAAGIEAAVTTIGTCPDANAR